MARKIPKGYKKGGVTSAKAKEILKHGKIKGKLLTDQQKKYFGWIAEGKKLENGGTSWYTPRELDISSMTSAGIGTLSSTGSGTNTDTPKDTGFSDVAGAGLGLTSAFFDVKYGKEEAERQRLIDEATSKVDTTGFQGALDREKALQESKDKNKRNYVEETALSTSLKMGAAGSSLGPLGTLGGLAAGAIAGTFLGKSIEKGAEATEAERRKKVGEGFVGIQEEKIATIDPTSRKEMDSTIPTVNVKKGGKVIKIGGKPLRKQTGGEIVGPGTGTSDDVPATLAQGSLIVPAKNNKKAEALRRTLLGQSPNQASPKLCRLIVDKKLNGLIKEDLYYK